MTKPAILLSLTVALAVSLGGCSINDIVKNRSTERSILQTGWVKPKIHYAEPIYCYRTLATPVCYEEPREGEESRLVGFFGPRPY